MKNKLLTLVALGMMVGGTAFARSHFSINVGVGPGYGYAYAPGYVYYPPPPPPRVAYAPRSPGRGYVYVDGYYVRGGGPRDYRWQQGYWTRPPRGYNRYVAPRYERDRYYNGYWR